MKCRARMVCAWWMVVATLGCTAVGALKPGDTGTPDAGSATQAVHFSFLAPDLVGPDRPSGNGGLALALSSGGEVAVAYFVDLTSTQVCTTNLNTQNIAEADLRLARMSDPDVGFSVMSVTHPRSADGVSAVYDAQGTLNVAFTGGANGTGVCGGTDLMLATVAPQAATAVITTLADNGNTSITCRSTQNSCNVGNVVGRYPSIAFDSMGQRVVSCQDSHYGFGVQVDLEESDLEVMLGNTMVTVDDSTGSAYQGYLFMAQDRPNVVHVQIKNHVFPTLTKDQGVWLARQKVDLTWEYSMVDGAVVPIGQISGAWHPTLGYAVAYGDPDLEDLWVARSQDGTTWTKEKVDSLGRTGRTPAVGWSQDALLVAYGACNAITDTGGACVPAHDGVKLAVKDATGWHIQTVYNNEEQLDGQDVRMVMDSHGHPWVAFKSAGTHQVLVVRGTRS